MSRPSPYFQGGDDGVDLGTSSPSPSSSSSSYGGSSGGLFSRRNILIGLVVLGAMLVVMMIALLAVFAAPYSYSLNPSGPNRLLVLESLSNPYPDGSPRVVARSYDGLPWELKADADVLNPAKLECNSNQNCVVRSRGRYRTREIPVPDSLKTPTSTARAAGGITTEQRIVRLMMQATFGATKAEVTAAATKYGTNVSGWIQDQMSLPPTMLRSYLRQRTSRRSPVPTPVAAPRSICSLGSRWHRYVFNNDDEKQLVDITVGSNAFQLRINGVLRGQVTEFIGNQFPGTGSPNVTFPAKRRLCYVDEVRGLVQISDSSTNCSKNTDIDWHNPNIEFASLDTSRMQSFTPAQATMTPVLSRSGVMVLSELMVECLGRNVAGDAYFRYDGAYYRYDPRLRLLENSLAKPADVNVSGAVQCPAVTKSFVNSDSCIRRSSCAPIVFFGADTPLENSTLRAWYTLSRRYVYFVTGLRLEDEYYDPPCRLSSRWLRHGATCPGGATSTSGINTTALDALRTRLVETAATDTNPYLVDISMPIDYCEVGKVNSASDNRTIGIKLMAGGQCYEHVHPNFYDVRDCTYWTRAHDGNDDALSKDRPNPIARWAENGYSHIEFPDHHPMSRWRQRQALLPVVGRYGDTIDFRTLATELQTKEVADSLGAERTTGEGGFEVCGSPGEDENKPVLGHRYDQPDQRGWGIRQRELDWQYDLNHGKSMLWQNVALSAPDQLRQRVAWALSQICTISSSGLGRDSENEVWAVYYDIFVRHAFGNYRDILREVSYNPLMADYLSFRRNRAFAVAGSFPDENYAREIMQLFSIGLWKLKQDGTQLTDSRGEPVATYTIDDIVVGARLWTGFDRQQLRGNFESLRGIDSDNMFDPMVIQPSNRDFLPKTKLDAGYIGDGYPLCEELPERHWLKPGARFVYTGKSSIEGNTLDKGEGEAGIRPRFAPDPASSQLYARLCAKDQGGKCTFPTEVVLTEELQCHGLECDAGRVLSVKIVDPTGPVTRYYTYVPVPCVRYTFHGPGAKIVRYRGTRQCADPRAPVGHPTCCLADNTDKSATNYTAECLFSNEKTTWAVAKARCEAMGHVLCDYTYNSWPTWATTCAERQFVWLDAPCQMQVEVYPSGLVGVYDKNSTDLNQFKLTSNSFFRVWWKDDKFPEAANGCGAGCKKIENVGGDTCLCDYVRTDSIVFSNMEQVPEKIEDIANRLPVGAALPSSFPTGTYSLCSNATCTARTDIKVWLKSGSIHLAQDTIFELPPRLAGGKIRYLLNSESIISVGESSSFRNPPHFMPLAGEIMNTRESWASDLQWLPQAEQEVEAFLDMLFENDSVAPFVAYRMIQRMVTSNPSPRYMTQVTNAFRTGTYGGQTFSGRYGDMAATVAAILLDPEARSPVLEADPSFGALREPIVKILYFMKSLGYRSHYDQEVHLPNLIDRIGQDAFRAPSVFGFYLTENRPAGPISNAGLASPEAELGTAPQIVQFLNGMTSLIDHGLSSCDRGFARNWFPQFDRTWRRCGSEGWQYADGNITYAPVDGATAEQVIDDLDLVLTAGRLNRTLRTYFLQEYNAEMTAKTPMDAMKLALKMFISTAEFHMTNANILSGKTRTSTATVQSQGRQYKAIVVLFLNGGFDSYNLVVPHSNCAGKDYYLEYEQVREGARVPKKDLLTISVDAGTQPCDTFGVHPNLPIVRQLYNAGEASFLANIGALVEPITKADYKKQSGVIKKLPPSLFAHNIMQRSMHNLHAQNSAAKGILARTINALLEQSTPFKSEIYSLMGNVKMVEGSKQAADIIDPNQGVVPFEQFDQLGHRIGNITQDESESYFAETFNALLDTSLKKTALIADKLEQTNLDITFGDDRISKQLRQVAKLIKMRADLETERAVFVTNRGGFDTHNTFDLTPMLDDMNAGLTAFVAEMKAQGIWDHVTVLTVSDFARTLTSNGQGTDHAWGGNHFIMGGGVNGGKFFGKFPEGLTEAAEMNIGRGRVIPTSAWESVWKGMVEWFGVEPGQMGEVLPNLANFPDSDVWGKNQLYK